jgi:thymidylate synthase (FAD)
MRTQIVAITQPYVRSEDNTRFLTAEEFIVYCARVSNPSNQLNLESAPKLIKYCINHGHWSIFEQASMTVEIQTSRDISAQILRHKTFAFQEFSQRYSVVTGIESFDIRKQAEKNRQSSTEILDLSEEDVKKITDHVTNGVELYQYIISKGGARECARKVLPLCTQTTLYMTGNIRSWIHYLELRCKEDTQLEHREIALSIRNSFNTLFPSIAEALTIDDKKIETKESPRKNTLLSHNSHPTGGSLIEPTPEEIAEKQKEFYEKNNILVLK